MVAAIESAGLVEQLGGQKEQLARLVESSPDGIVTTDRAGCITAFNSRASEILGYTLDGLRGQHFRNLLWDPDAAAEIEQRLEQAPDSKLSGFKTFARARPVGDDGSMPPGSRRGEKVHVRLSAAGLFGANGERLGSVGYFEDLRPIIEAETQRQILLDGIEAVGRAETLQQGLHSLAENIVAACHATFCHILLLSADGQSLEIKAAYPTTRQPPLKWKPRLEKIHQTFSRAEFEQILSSNQPLVYQDANAGHRDLLQHLSEHTQIGSPLHSALVVPFKVGSTPLGLVIVAEMRNWERSPFTEREIELTRSLATQAAALIEKMRLHELTQQRLVEITHHDDQLTILTEIANTIQAASDPEKILHVVLTGITAGYGLGLNRAALFHLDDHQKHLEGWMGIGHLKKRNAERDWARHHLRGLEDFDRFLVEMDRGNIPLTPIERRVQKLRLPVDVASDDVFSQAILTRQPILLTGSLDNLPKGFVRAFEPALPLVVMPLLAREQVIGLLVADNKFTGQAITDETLEMLRTFANSAAVAIDHHTRFKDEQAAREKISSAFQASSSLVSSQTPRQVLVDIVRQMEITSGASWVSVIMADKSGRLRDFYTTDKTREPGTRVEQVVRPNGYTMRVMRTGKMVVIEDTHKQTSPHVNREMYHEQAEAALCLPIFLQGRQIGAIWVHYDHPRRFQQFELEALQLYVNQAAIFYNNAQRMEELEQMRVVAELTTLGDLNTTLDHIVEGTRKVLDCDVVTLYIYDADQDRFLFPPAMVGVWNRAKVLNYGYVAEGSIIHEILAMEEPYIAEDALTDRIMGVPFAQREKIIASVGIPLKTHGHKVGVMFVNLRRPHHFTSDEITNIRLFANQAAVAIHNTQLFQEIHKRAEVLNALYEAGKAITSTLTLDEALQRICEQALKIIGRDPLDESCFSHVALLEGHKLRFIAASTPGILEILHQKIGAIDLAKDEQTGIAGRAARQGQTQVVEAIQGDPDFICCDSRTRSQLSVVLKKGARQIGVLSIEHPEVKAFSAEDVRSVELLAAQAAVSIDNARQYNELQGTLDELRQTRIQVDARSTLAMMGMATNQWRHIIEGHAINICNNVTLLRQELDGVFQGQDIPARLEEKLRRIENLATMIEDKPVTPPLSSEEGMADILIHDLIYERLYQLWGNEPYRSIQREILFKTEYAALVRASSEWLRRAFDIIIDNAVDELQYVPKERRLFTVTTRPAGDLLEIEFADTGRGIPEEIKGQLFRKRVEKTGSLKGLGIGLLMAQAIIETYNGTISVQDNQPTGTKVLIRLPFWQSPYTAE